MPSISYQMKNKEKRNLHQLSAWNRKAGVHKDQKNDKKIDRLRARREEKNNQQEK